MTYLTNSLNTESWILGSTVPSDYSTMVEADFSSDTYNKVYSVGLNKLFAESHMLFPHGQCLMFIVKLKYYVTLKNSIKMFVL